MKDGIIKNILTFDGSLLVLKGVNVITKGLGRMFSSME